MPSATPRPSLAYLIIAGISWPIVRLAFRTRWRGTEYVPRYGGFVLAANHTSNFDAWPLALGLFPRRYLRFMAKAELFNFILGPLLRALGAFRVRRGSADAEAFVTAVRLCQQDHCVVMFPEGTRRRKGLRKKLQAQAHTGAARIALKAGVPLVPAAIKGTDRLFRLGPLSVAYGPPVPLHDLIGRRRRDAAQIATERLMMEIERLERTL